jgi:hypothetical protein
VHSPTNVHHKEKHKEGIENSVDGQLSAIAGVSDHQIKRSSKILEKAFSVSQHVDQE